MELERLRNRLHQAIDEGNIDRILFLSRNLDKHIVKITKELISKKGIINRPYKKVL